MYIIIITCYWLFSNDIMAVKRLTSTETIKLIRDGEKRMLGGWGGMAMREEDCYYIPAVTTRMTSACRWAAMRAILMFHSL